ncbi:MAG: PAS domain-containing protein [Rhodothermales bacterium]
MSDLTAHSSEHHTARTSDLVRKRFQNPLLQHPSLTLDEEGMIVDMSNSALPLLEYTSPENIRTSFFSLVHSKNLYQVMRDVADMACYGKNHATWLLRLRTGKGRWRWYKITAKNELSKNQRRIVLTLRDVHEW